MIAVINYANNKYKDAQEFNSKMAYKRGKAAKVFSYKPEDIEEKFFEKNKKILQIDRGNGLWLWKPYFIKKTLEKVKYGDILFYIDSGAYITKDIDRILNKVSNFDIICFDIPLIEKQFTKKIAFQKMNCNEKKYRDSNQIIATYFFIKKTKIAERFIDEWLNLCCDYELITPSNNKDEDENFIAHREDQSIFSLLCKKYGIEPYNDISQRYYFPKSYKYDKKFIYRIPKHKTIKLPIILYLHKMNKVSYIKLLKHRIKTFLSLFN